MKGLRPDPFVVALLATVLAASLLPARGVAAEGLALAAKGVIAMLFFLHGAKLSREAVIAGLTHWRLHLTVLAITFALFPLLGLAAGLLPGSLLPAPLATGVLFLACLPSTVQSSIAFTSIARGNVAAAVCSASASNLLGMALTPLLVGLLLHAQGAGVGAAAVQAILLQLLAPFLAGQAARPLVGPWLAARARIVGVVDRFSVLLIVYSAFSGAVVAGVWTQVSAGELVVVAVLSAVLLGVVLAGSRRLARRLGFSTEDEVVVVFCGSKKSLITGAPMAAILFPAATAGLTIIPLMIYHQLQMIACAVIAQRYAARGGDDGPDRSR
ncbi:MAG: bile acid:sodium symporter family protein [Pseudomonadota bacterium]